MTSPKTLLMLRGPPQHVCRCDRLLEQLANVFVAVRFPRLEKVRLRDALLELRHVARCHC